MQYYWIIRARRELDEVIPYQVFPSGGIDIIYDFYYRYLGWIGFIRRPIQIYLRGQAHLFGIKLQPEVTPFFLNQQASMVVDRHIKMSEGFRHGRMLSDQVYQAEFLLGRIRLIEEELFGIFQDYEKDINFSKMLQLIYARKGQVSVNELASILHLSERQLLREFNKKLGFSVKQFIALIRFQGTLHKMMEAKTGPMDWADLALQCGYYDQPHFINDFKKYFAETPQQLYFRLHQISLP